MSIRRHPVPVSSILPGELWPMCSICGHQVEHVEIEHDWLTERFIFRVMCHDDVEECEVDREFFEAPGTIAASAVFVGKALPPGQAALPEG